MFVLFSCAVFVTYHGFMRATRSCVAFLIRFIKFVYPFYCPRVWFRFRRVAFWSQRVTISTFHIRVSIMGQNRDCVTQTVCIQHSLILLWFICLYFGEKNNAIFLKTLISNCIYKNNNIFWILKSFSGILDNRLQSTLKEQNIMLLIKIISWCSQQLFCCI